jgi:iron complex transport system substrate-binding protein
VIATAALLLGAVAPAAAPNHVVSLNLCTDEMLLVAARPGQIASISKLGADANETPLAAHAGGLLINNGRLTDVLDQHPDLVLTMGDSPQQAALAKRLGIRLIALPYPQSPAEVVAQVQQVAALLGNPAAGAAFARQVEALSRTAAAKPVDALMLGGGGLAPAMGGLAAGWLRLAGLRQRQSGPVAMETLLTDPPAVLLFSRYRPGQFSLPQAWVSHPALKSVRARRLDVDGRAFLCGGVAMPAEVRRLQQATAAEVRRLKAAP